MQNIWPKYIKTAAVLTLAVSGLVSLPTTVVADTDVATITAGKKLAFDSMKGNCLACHVIVGGEFPGTIAPALNGVKKRYPDIAKLRSQIWDATVANPLTSMPPYGRHRILTDKELDQVTAFIWTQ